jgi:hypothetical protein
MLVNSFLIHCHCQGKLVKSLWKATEYYNQNLLGDSQASIQDKTE